MKDKEGVYLTRLTRSETLALWLDMILRVNCICREDGGERLKFIKQVNVKARLYHSPNKD